MTFNLQEYELVETRLARFHKEFPNGRVITELEKAEGDTVIVKAFLYKNYEDEKPWATGFAEETRGVGSPVNKTAHVENCETSAIGRALANAGFAPKGKRPSREEMQKVARNGGTKVPRTEWQDKKPTDKQVKAMWFKAKAEGENPKEMEAKVLKAGNLSDYIGNKITFAELLERSPDKDA